MGTWKDKVETTAIDNYEEYIKNFTDTNNDPMYVTPRMRGLQDFDFVDQNTKGNLMAGYADKYCMRASVSLLRDLIREVKTNPNVSYQVCYTNDEIRNDETSDYYSVVMKQPDSLEAVEAEVFASRVLNYFGVPVAYNRRIDRAIPNYPTENYLMSVDMIRRNERLVLLDEIIPVQRGYVDIDNFKRGGLKNTLDFVGDSLKNYLGENGINYTEEDIEEYLKFLSTSILIRKAWMSEGDLRNGNTGILIDLEKKKFRPLPNFDMEDCFTKSRLDYEELKQLHDFDPEGYDRFVEKMYEFLKLNDKKESACTKMAHKYIRDEKIAGNFVNKLYMEGGRILKLTEQIKKECSDKNKADEGNQILA